MSIRKYPSRYKKLKIRRRENQKKKLDLNMYLDIFVINIKQDTTKNFG